MHVDLEQLDRRAAELVQEIGIPPCPAILVRILAESRVGDPDFKKICELIANDVSLAGSILATVNSAFYGLRTKARSIDAAVMLLGIRNVATLVTGLMLRQAFPIAKNQQLQTFWDASARTASLCAYVATETRAAARDFAYTFGLFRDSGMLALAAKFPEYVKEVYPAHESGGRVLIGEERTRYNFHHAEIGCELGRTWELPEDMCLAILHHHDYAVDAGWRLGAERSSLRLSAVGLLADWMETQIRGRLNPEWEKAKEFVLDTLDFRNEDRLEEMLDGAREAMKNG